ncbi:DNA-binding MarR family transcriptional regulator [Rhizobium sp. PP-F2F-G48]|uniref:MarR family winged helix-turn-helix transcriptional regulator n=1 Tax=Rhizobium sp. PP-F2F-G48 TaxID=2135651 RepID=UPI001047E771|nr:MarR family winged helix-turn-helix transcriptional regulator [Rhizobium sp. PP-F2F-G48]TCM53703.1 DNA-binding MarR family transcriptional regulator [Rhizobium sp. PP-F2F-G48]
MGKKDKSEKKAKQKKLKIDKIVDPAAIDGEGGLEAAAPLLAPLLAQAARSMRTVLSRNLLESGLYAGQDGVMLALAETDGMTAGSLAGHLGVKAPTMTRTIGRMEAQGFLERKPDAADARLTKVYLTANGRERLQAIEAAADLSEATALTGMTDKQIRTLAKLLKLVDANLQAVE